MKANDLYFVLGVDRTASQDQVKAAYRACCRAFHPDKHPGDEWKAERFKEVSAAYEVLGDPERRAAYDAELARADAPAPGDVVSEVVAAFERATGEPLEETLGRAVKFGLRRLLGRS